MAQPRSLLKDRRTSIDHHLSDDGKKIIADSFESGSIVNVLIVNKEPKATHNPIQFNEN